MLTKTNHATTPTYDEAEKSVVEKTVQGLIFPLTGRASTVAGEKRDFLDRGEVTYVAAAWAVTGAIVGSKLARANAANGREPFLGFIG